MAFWLTSSCSLADLVLRGQLFGIVLRLVVLDAADDAERVELLVGVAWSCAWLYWELICGRRGPLIHEGAGERGLEALVVGLGLLDGELRIEQLLLELRIGQVHEDGIRGDLRAGQHADADDGSVGLRRDQLDALFAGNQGAEAADLHDHVAALHGFRPDGAGVDAGNGRLETHDGPCGRGYANSNQGQHEDLPAELLLPNVGASDVHCKKVSCMCRAIRGPLPGY